MSPLLAWIDALREEQAMVGPELPEESFQGLADGMAQAFQGTCATGEIEELRTGFIQPWRNALTQGWKLQRREIKSLREILKNSKSRLVAHLLAKITDDIQKEMREEQPFQEPTGPGPVKNLKPIAMRDSIVYGNFARHLKEINLGALTHSETGDPRISMKRTSLGELLKYCLLAINGHVDAMISWRDKQRGAREFHQEDMDTMAEGAIDLKALSENALKCDMIELICGSGQDLEEIRTAISAMVVATAITFGHREGRHMLCFHPTSHGKCWGMNVLDMRARLKHQTNEPQDRLRLAGQLVAALGISSKKNQLRNWEGMTNWVANDTPALMSHYTKGVMDNLLLRERSGREPMYDHYVYPPSAAKVNGVMPAPLAGLMDHRLPTDQLTEAVRQSWAETPGREAILTINAATLLMVALNILPSIRENEDKETNFMVPAAHKRFLETSVFPGAADYLDAANRAKDHEIKDDRWLASLNDSIEKTEAAGDAGEGIREFQAWAIEWAKTPGTGVASCGACEGAHPDRPGIAQFNVGKVPYKSMKAHMKDCHTTTGIQDRKEKARIAAMQLNQARRGVNLPEEMNGHHGHQSGHHGYSRGRTGPPRGWRGQGHTFRGRGGTSNLHHPSPDQERRDYSENQRKRMRPESQGYYTSAGADRWNP